MRALASTSLLAARAGGRAAAAAADPERRAAARQAVDGALSLGMGVLAIFDEAYPTSLRHLADPPPVLFLRGRRALLGTPGVAVVGSRKATARARDVSFQLGRALAEEGIPVVSGLALGVDGAAHRGAVEGRGPTVAVLGTGADRAYPSSHRTLFRRIVETGLVVSEFPPGTPALPHHFPRRNRILAALAHTLVVVEAASRSGALISVDHALDLGLDVWAVPGPIQEPACAGSNALLADGARPLVSVDAFLQAVAGTAPRAAEEALDGVAADAGPEARVLEALSQGGRSADEVARVTGLPTARALSLLSALELEGRVQRIPGMRFRKAG